MRLINNKIKTIFLKKIEPRTRIYMQKMENGQWLLLLPFDYYGEQAFLYKKKKGGYHVTGEIHMVDTKQQAIQYERKINRDFHYTYTKAIYI